MNAKPSIQNVVLTHNEATLKSKRKIPADHPINNKIDSKQPSNDKRRIQIRRSGVHGKGVFAIKNILKGDMILEYVGEIVSWEEAQKRHPHDPNNPNHTFYFHIDENHVIDGKFGGNSSRFINHSCEPNCAADENERRIFIRALRDIEAGEELSFDYGLVTDERHTKKLKAQYPCFCGTSECRGTLLASKR